VIRMEDVKAKAEERRCPLQKAIVFIEEFLNEPLCGECLPCTLGSQELKIRLQKIADGKGTQLDIDAIDKITGHMLEISRCRKGMDTARFIIDSTKEGSFKGHLEGVCNEKECLSLIMYRIIPEKCVMCGTCQDICKENAIIGEKKKPLSYQPIQINARKCRSERGCNECVRVCPTGAIEVIEVEGRYLPFEISQKRCTRCDECIKVCPVSGAIGVIEIAGLRVVPIDWLDISKAIGVADIGFRPFEIVQKRCTTKCGECIKGCPSGAIEVVDIKEQVAVGS